jgi:zinc protease
VSRDDVASHLARHVTAPNLVVGVAGDIDADALPRLMERALAPLSRAKVSATALAAPQRTPGRRLVIVDKPGRTQTQMFVGTLGSRLRDPDFHTLLVANTAFGGTFSAPLIQQVRAQRGFSYSASSRLGADREREAWTIYTHPSAENAKACLALELELVERFVSRGPSAAELRFAKGYLVKSHAFDLDTPQKRLEPRVEAEVHGLPRAFHEKFVERVSEVELDAARAAIHRRLTSDDLTIALVATARDVTTALSSLVDDVRVIPFDRI